MVGFWWEPSTGLRRADFHTHMMEDREKQLILSDSYKGTNPSMRALVSMTSSNHSYLPKVSSPNITLTVGWRLGGVSIPTYKCWKDTNIQSITQCSWIYRTVITDKKVFVLQYLRIFVKIQIHMLEHIKQCLAHNESTVNARYWHYYIIMTIKQNYSLQILYNYVH